MKHQSPYPASIGSLRYLYAVCELSLSVSFEPYSKIESVRSMAVARASSCRHSFNFVEDSRSNGHRSSVVTVIYDARHRCRRAALDILMYEVGEVRCPHICAGRRRLNVRLLLGRPVPHSSQTPCSMPRRTVALTDTASQKGSRRQTGLIDSFVGQARNKFSGS